MLMSICWSIAAGIHFAAAYNADDDDVRAGAGWSFKTYLPPKERR